MKGSDRQAAKAWAINTSDTRAVKLELVLIARRRAGPRILVYDSRSIAGTSRHQSCVIYNISLCRDYAFDSSRFDSSRFGTCEKIYTTCAGGDIWCARVFSLSLSLSLFTVCVSPESAFILDRNMSKIMECHASRPAICIFGVSIAPAFLRQVVWADCKDLWYSTWNDLAPSERENSLR